MANPGIWQWPTHPSILAFIVIVMVVLVMYMTFPWTGTPY